MGTLYLVRHGQASFGADDYDQLSALGRQQAVRLGEYWRGKGQHFDAVITGTLRRHAQIPGGPGPAGVCAAPHDCGIAPEAVVHVVAGLCRGS